ncbi:hypothetical protein [Streptomyces sp. NPDC046759]|uniref:hypothetical protein n=1 Tax=Streptomyces sp. NPDC046759 TaxID=3155019 RepID=UPI003411A2CB
MVGHTVRKDEVARLLTGLRALGLRPGDRVVLVLEPSQDFVPVLGGFVPCPMAPLRGDGNGGPPNSST